MTCTYVYEAQCTVYTDLKKSSDVRNIRRQGFIPGTTSEQMTYEAHVGLNFKPDKNVWYFKFSKKVN
jgi:hypothetical protein